MTARDLIAWEDRHGKAAPGQWLFWASTVVGAGIIHATVAPVWQPLKWAQATMDPDWLACFLAGPGLYAGFLIGFTVVGVWCQRFRWYRRAFRNGQAAQMLMLWGLATPAIYLLATCLLGLFWGMSLLIR